MLLTRFLVLALVTACWPGPAWSQEPVAPGEAPEMPAFDMFDLDTVDEDAIALPPLIVLPPDDAELEPLVPPRPDVDDPCRHLSQQDRQRLTLLCGPNA